MTKLKKYRDYEKFMESEYPNYDEEEYPVFMDEQTDYKRVKV